MRGEHRNGLQLTRSIMWEEKRGVPVCLKKASSASNMPSSHGRSFLAPLEVSAQSIGSYTPGPHSVQDRLG